MTPGKPDTTSHVDTDIIIIRNGYYAHAPGQGVTGDPGAGAGSWHEPVAGARSDSPGGGAGGGQYPGQGGTGQNMYSCKMQGPPSPQETKVTYNTLMQFEMVHFSSFSKSKLVLGFRDCETYAESYFFSLAFLEPILKCQNCLRIDMKDVECRSCFFTDLPKLKIDKA